MVWYAYDSDNERAILKFNGPYLLPPFGLSFIGTECPRSAYDSDNERALLKFNGPYREQTSEFSFVEVIRPQVVQTTKLIRYGNVKIYGTPNKADRVKEEEDE